MNRRAFGGDIIGGIVVCSPQVSRKGPAIHRYQASALKESIRILQSGISMLSIHRPTHRSTRVYPHPPILILQSSSSILSTPHSPLPPLHIHLTPPPSSPHDAPHQKDVSPSPSIPHVRPPYALSAPDAHSPRRPSRCGKSHTAPRAWWPSRGSRPCRPWCGFWGGDRGSRCCRRRHAG